MLGGADAVGQSLVGQWFVRFINDASEKQLQMAMDFITGTIHIPLHHKIIVRFVDASPPPVGRLPTAGLCFSDFKLCHEYEEHEEEDFVHNLKMAFQHCRTLGQAG